MISGEQAASDMADSHGLYPGWIVLAACFLCAMLVIGGSIYIYQLFVLPVTAELGITRGEASYAFIAFLFGIALWSPLIGRLFDRVSARVLMPLGGLAYAAGMIIISQAASPIVMLAAVPTFLGLAMALAGGLAANTITTRWFARRRGRALGIAAIASSAGGFAMLPLVTFLIERFGWRDALLFTGCGAGLIIVLIALVFVRDRPGRALIARYGESAAADASPTDASAALGDPLFGFGDIVKTARFWMITLAVGLLLASDQAVLTTQFPYFVDIGFSATQATTIITAMTGSAIIGKLLVGFLAERWDIRWLYVFVALFHALLLGALLLQPGYFAMLAFVSIFGAAVGGIYPVWSVLCSQAFGARSFGTAFGATAMFTQALAIVFVGFINGTFDKTGSYQSAYLAFLGAIVAGVGAIALLRLPATDGRHS